jgi:hypothetical protein
MIAPSADFGMHSKYGVRKPSDKSTKVPEYDAKKFSCSHASVI